MNARAAKRSAEWHAQWSLFTDTEQSLLEEWIAPVRLEDFQGLDVLECGCGGGQHTGFIAPFARSVTAVDLNTADLAKARNERWPNVMFLDDDIAAMDLCREFDIVLCVGVIHHTDVPDRTFANIFRHCREGGRVIVWTYSAEGNWPIRYLVEPMRKAFFRHLPRPVLVTVSRLVTAALYPIVHSVYRLERLQGLPYFEYFRTFRRLSFQRNLLNVFDKLNAPQTLLTPRRKCEEWFSAARFDDSSIIIRRHAGVSWTLTGIKRCRQPDAVREPVMAD